MADESDLSDLHKSLTAAALSSAQTLRRGENNKRRDSSGRTNTSSKTGGVAGDMEYIVRYEFQFGRQ